MSTFKLNISYIIQSLYPSFEEYAERADDYWMKYAVALDDIDYEAETSDSTKGLGVINKLLQRASTTPEHHAACDVASTIESLDKSFVGKFKY